MLTASLVPGLCLGCVPLLGADTAAVLAVTSLALTCYGSMFCGVFSNHADLAPSLAGTLMAVTNMVATLPGVLSTIISEYCVPRNKINTLTLTYLIISLPLIDKHHGFQCRQLDPFFFLPQNLLIHSQNTSSFHLKI